MAAEKGESGAEAVALEIGSYMGEVKSIYEFDLFYITHAFYSALKSLNTLAEML